MYTSGNDILDADGKQAFETFIRGGGGWLGLHSAADTEYEWPLYQQLVVSAFDSHPAVQPATLTIEDSAHPAMAQVPFGPWSVEDEWYNFRSSPRATAGVQILATIDEATYSGGTMGDDHPMIWSHALTGGRALYSALGHVPALWNDPAFVNHVVDGLRWVARANE